MDPAPYRPLVEVDPYQLRPSRHDAGWAGFLLSAVVIVVLVIGAVVL